MPSLTDLELQLHISQPPAGSSNTILQLQTSDCPSVTSFHLRLPAFDMGQGLSLHRCVASFLQALRMPHLEALSFSIEFWNMRRSESECTEFLSDLSVALLPNHFADPRACLSSLSYEFTYTPCDFYSIGHLKPTPLKMFPRIFTVPLDRIPTVSNLTLTMCTQMCFTRENYVGGCRLREIRFSGCEHLEIGDLRSAVQSLKGVQAWNSVERIVVEGCSLLDYSVVLDVIGSEKLRYST